MVQALMVEYSVVQAFQEKIESAVGFEHKAHSIDIMALKAENHQIQTQNMKNWKEK